MELTVNKDYNKCGNSEIRKETKVSDIYVEENPYVNTTIGFCKTVTDKHESHTYEDIKRMNFDASDVKIANRGYFTRCKQYINAIVLSLIGVLFAAVIAIAIVVALPKGHAVNGGWSDWSTWGACSATCGTGLQHRTRTCSNPAPDLYGRPCLGDFSDHQLCAWTVCQEINGGWSTWGSWSQCSVTCDYGMTYRERTCSNPVPARGGLYCSGSSTDFRLCNQALCPAINGGWSVWSAWGTCSATCGQGLQSRTRTCTNPAPEQRGKPCFGDVSDQQLCNIKACDGTGIGFSVFNPQTGAPVKFVSAFFNYNNVYNTTTGEFVCPKRGLYYFQVTLIRQSLETSSSYCAFYRNNNWVFYLYMSSSFNSPHASGSVLVDLLPGDRIYISGCGNLGAFDGYSTFSGFLINTV